MMPPTLERNQHAPSLRSAVLDVTDLTTSYATKSGVVTPVRGVSLSVCEGGSLGIVGESGSGKSVLVRSILGVHPARSSPTVTGSVRLNGRETIGLDAKSRRALLGAQVSLIHQDPLMSLNPVVTIGEQVAEAVVNHSNRESRSTLRSRVLELLRSTGLREPEQQYRKYPHELSGGQRQRVGIAAAAITAPTLMIGDEPTTALDVTVQKQVLDMLEDVRRQQNSALVLITHDLGVAAERCDEIAVMYGGRIVEQGPSAQIVGDPRHPYTKALLACGPRLDGPRPLRLPSIPGGAARPDRPNDTGCAFAERCSFARDSCSTTPQHLQFSGSSTHRVACSVRTDAESAA
ncbi:ABC transporter ATP-binding protein [Humidisolicoccus flavus]|uniref:ABC transporter ATP-binding protein n=1 Tax=Humidisolicoccus flavus TaxID=3111414 RepID=UPI00324CEDAD